MAEDQCFLDYCMTMTWVPTTLPCVPASEPKDGVYQHFLDYSVTMTWATTTLPSVPASGRKDGCVLTICLRLSGGKSCLISVGVGYMHCSLLGGADEELRVLPPTKNQNWASRIDDGGVIIALPSLEASF